MAEICIALFYFALQLCFIYRHTQTVSHIELSKKTTRS